MFDLDGRVVPWWLHPRFVLCDYPENGFVYTDQSYAQVPVTGAAPFVKNDIRTRPRR